MVSRSPVPSSFPFVVFYNRSIVKGLTDDDAFQLTVDEWACERKAFLLVYHRAPSIDFPLLVNLSNVLAFYTKDLRFSSSNWTQFTFLTHLFEL